MNTRQYFDSLSDEDKYILLHETELKVAKLTRLSQDLLCWKESSSSSYYREAEKELLEFLQGENGG